MKALEENAVLQHWARALRLEFQQVLGHKQFICLPIAKCMDAHQLRRNGNGMDSVPAYRLDTAEPR